MIEDNADIAGLYRTILLDEGHEVELVRPLDDLAVIAKCDAVILDLMMPGVDGEAVLDFIAAHCPTMRTVVATAMYSVPDRVRAVAHTVLIKPFTPGDLLNALAATAL